LRSQQITPPQSPGFDYLVPKQVNMDNQEGIWGVAYDEHFEEVPKNRLAQKNYIRK
jgi:hypothetical protein